MSEQLALVEIPADVTLTDRQQAILTAVKAGGWEGVDASEIGALLCERRGRHTREQRCRFDGQNGKGALRELEAKGVVRYRRAKRQTPGGWIATDAADDRMPSGMTDVIPF